MNKIVAAITLATASVLPAVAEIAPEEYQELELGKEYTLEFMKSFYGKYTPTVNGQILEYGDVPVYLMDSGELTLMTETEGYRYAGYINGKQAHQFPVSAGTTYYFKSDFIMNNGVISIELNPEVSLTKSIPDLGDAFDPAVTDQIELIFNQNITVEAATVKVGDFSAPADNINTLGSTISVGFNEILRRWYNENRIKPGEILQITLSGVKDGLDNPINDLVFQYRTVSKPVELKEYSLPVELLSWYSEDVNAAKAVFTFTGALAEDQKVELCYAPVELGYEYIENVKSSVNDNVLTVDFGGVRRTSAEMSTSGRADTQIYLRLNTLKDVNGQTVWSDGQGTVGTFLYEIPFAEIPKLNITSEFTPSTGSSLENVTAINIYFNCADHLTYDGVAFTSGNERIVVNSDAIRIDPISDTEVELTVPVPAGWNTKENVIVTLEGLTSDDGFDHSGDVTAKFNGFTLTYCSIRNGARMKSLAEGTTVKAETNLGNDAKLMFAIEGELEPVEMTGSGDGIFMLTMPQTVVFEKDKPYSIIFTAVPGGIETITIVGDTAPYEFSDIELASVTPSAGSAIDPDTEISLNFTGLVSLTPAPGSIQFVADPVGSVEGGYASEWHLKLENNAAEGQVIVAFAAKDMAGAVLQGNEGADADSYFSLTFTVSSAGTIEVETMDSTVMFDLLGRQITKKPSGGIYIRGGKKILL